MASCNLIMNTMRFVLSFRFFLRFVSIFQHATKQRSSVVYRTTNIFLFNHLDLHANTMINIDLDMMFVELIDLYFVHADKDLSLKDIEKTVEECNDLYKIKADSKCQKKNLADIF